MEVNIGAINKLTTWGNWNFTKYIFYKEIEYETNSKLTHILSQYQDIFPEEKDEPYRST